MTTFEEKKVPYVNETCIGCGACVAICNEVFDLDDDGKAFAIEGMDSSNATGIDDAISACPVNAIHYK
ncbi:MAG: ferredoxin [Candidatus Gracilibacteria bacterium]|nr:ferredoxin [Candidatus Gracilibacteria bacterium]